MQRSLGASRREAYLKDPTISSSGSSAYDGLKLSTRTDLLSNDKLDTKLDRGGAGDSDNTSSITSSKLAATGPMSVEGFVGFANLPNQVYRKSVKRGFEFNLMVVGQSGLGKSTLINSLFLTEVYNGEHVGPSKRIKKTVYVETNTAILKENGVHLKLSIVDTPGFGDAVDNSNCWTPVVDYIDSKFEEYLTNESKVNRGSFSDQRIHCCVYFIAPTGHSLRPLDVEFMKRIHDKVNIIPVIAKADTMTPEECRDFKKTILNEITQHKIRIYEFPDVDDDEDQKYKRLKDRVPFAVVGSNVLTDSKIGSSGKIRSRVYPWGVVEVENLEHNDFLALRNLILRTHMQDLKDVTNNVHYENYRFAKLSGIAQEGKFQTKDGKDPMAQMEAEKKENEKKMKKMEAEMKQVFELKVKEKMQKLKDSELDLQRRAEQMKKQIEQQEKELEERRRTFQMDVKTWEEANRDFEQRRRSLENMASQEKVIDIKEKSKTKKKGLF